MTRVKRGVVNRRRHKKVLKATAGHSGSRHRLFKTANESLIHALAYQYRDRRNRKRDMHRLWITRINAAARARAVIQQAHGSTLGARCRDKPKDAGGPGRPRRSRVCRAGGGCHRRSRRKQPEASGGIELSDRRSSAWGPRGRQYGPHASVDPDGGVSRRRKPWPLSMRLC